ncbi:L,D-transpeptidase family protein [Nocardioides sp. CER19]|uniref:L,D-transpeptidase family protein n=1 Tax=Nocardioides sp. CER19 TaxID=3038538 RepID=UPI00244B9952|nr:L,D-transpeptidase family protein [Nocardioides sp. CER19]MDH2416547.1 peptidoglycan-binding protein [Nocardioides sp. CER19]
MQRLAVALTVLLVGGLMAPAHGAGTAWVRQAQRALNGLRCDAGPVDGRIGLHTRSAVVRLQSRHGLPTNGHLDRATRRLLTSGTARRCDRRPVPRHSGTGRRIVVSQAQNWVWLVGARGRVVAQGGVVDNPAVLHKGTWRTGSYCGRPARVVKNQSGAVYMDHFVRFAPCGIGFHRIPTYKTTGAQMHPDWYLGTDLAGDSHGCVRLSAALATRLWDFTAGRTATTVKVL